MKKQLIATLVGGLILFIWQFVSWGMMVVHESEMAYTPNQDKIMEALNQNLTEAGTYYMPNVPPGTSHEEGEAAMQPHIGKPWATVSYHKSLDMSMHMNMIRGFAVDLLAAFLLTWLLLKFENLNIMTALQSSIAVGLIGYLTIPYLNSIWFEGNSIGHLIDAVVSWGLVGLWLGWWLTRSPRVA